MNKMSVINYAVMPGIIPRLTDFYRSGFAHISFLLAHIYAAVRLLPDTHPYLNKENFGKFGIRHVIAQAANNLVLDRKNADKVFVFFVLLIGIVLLFLQIVLLISAIVFLSPAMAGSGSLPPLILAPWGDPPAYAPITGPHHQDIAAIILDRVFGLKSAAGAGYFGSCVGDTSVACLDNLGNAIAGSNGAYPWAFHEALHAMLGFYSYGIFFIGATLIIYYITAIVAETAANGSAFGKRVNKAWTPFRLMLFFFLLLPVGEGVGTYGNGLNFGQLFVMNVVYTGSNFATNGWLHFTDGTAAITGDGTPYTAQDSLFTQQQQIIANPKLNMTEVDDLIYFMSVVQTCKYAYQTMYSPAGSFPLHKFGKGELLVKPYIIRGEPDARYGTPPSGIDTARPLALPFETTNFADALAFNFNSDIVIRFGLLGPDLGGGAGVNKNFIKYEGNVMPLCGDVVLKVSDMGEPGAAAIQEEYYGILINLYQNSDIRDHAACWVTFYLTPINSLNKSCTDRFGTSIMASLRKDYLTLFRTAITNGINTQKTAGGGLFAIPDEVKAKGWAGAALWYNKISEMNGAITSASFNIPEPTRLPNVLERVIRDAKSINSNVSGGANKFQQVFADKENVHIYIEWSDDHLEQIASALGLLDTQLSVSITEYAGTLGRRQNNLFVDYVNMLFGTSGLFDMRESADVHPLAQLSTLGQGLMKAVVNNTFNAALATGAAMATSGQEAKTAQTAASFFSGLVATTIGVAVILYYILPMMPFLYFMFAVSGWVKSIFEAMVAIPLWALAHLKIDGDGAMGPFAFNGYVLILEIFLRPILILSGLIASLSTFSALVWVLNIIFDQISVNVGGFDFELESTGPASSFLDYAADNVDVFFYTVIYAVLCYMMGVSSFKLVDGIPNQILRWMGVSTPTFQEKAGDPVGKLAGSVKQRSVLLVNQVRGRASGLADFS